MDWNLAILMVEILLDRGIFNLYLKYKSSLEHSDAGFGNLKMKSKYWCLEEALNSPTLILIDLFLTMQKNSN